jgi:hypothetical protein
MGSEVGIHTALNLPEVCISDPAFVLAQYRSAAVSSAQPPSALQDLNLDLGVKKVHWTPP